MNAHRTPDVGAHVGDVDGVGDLDAFVAHLDRVRAQATARKPATAAP